MINIDIWADLAKQQSRDYLIDVPTSPAGMLPDAIISYQ